MSVSRGIICFRQGAERHGGLEGPVVHPLSDWMLCGLLEHELVFAMLIAAGFLTANEDAGLLYWRARFWRPSICRGWGWNFMRGILQ